MSPPQLSVNLGRPFRLFCFSTPLLPVTWTKINGNISDVWEIAEGNVQVFKSTVEHAGKYRCHAENRAGSSEAFAIVTVLGRYFVQANVSNTVAHGMQYDLNYEVYIILELKGIFASSMMSCVHFLLLLLLLLFWLNVEFTRQYMRSTRQRVSLLWKLFCFVLFMLCFCFVLFLFLSLSFVVCFLFFVVCFVLFIKLLTSSSET